MIIKEFKKDKLLCKIYSDRDQMGASAAESIALTIRQILTQQNDINIVFAAAPSQNDVLRHLIGQDVEWHRVNAFHMDEYIGLDERPEKMFAHYLNKTLFQRVTLKQINYIGNGAAAGICTRYEQLIRAHPIDIVCLGIGENAHIAFNDPDVADFNDQKMIKVVKLDEVCRRQQVRDRTFDSLEEVPEYAITLTIPTLMSAKYLFCIVPTKSKANAVLKTMTAEICHKIPSTILRKHENAILFTELESAELLLQVGCDN